MAASHDELNSMTGREPVLSLAQRNAKRTDDAVRQQLAQRAAPAAGEPMPFMQFLAGQPNALAAASAGAGTQQKGASPAVVRNPRSVSLQMPEAPGATTSARPTMQRTVVSAPPAPFLQPPPSPTMSALPAMTAMDEDGLADHIGDRVGDVMGELMGEFRGELRGEFRTELVSRLKGELQGALKGDLRSELRTEMTSIRNWMASQLETMSYHDNERRRPVAAAIQKALLSAGFSPKLARDVAARLPHDFDVNQARSWTCAVLERNLVCTPETLDPIDAGGIYALVGPTGVGKTTTVAKLASRCAVKYGRDSVGLVTIDSYRIGAQDQLRIYGKILGITVHTAQDRDSLLAVLRSLAGKRLVLIDTVGLGQRDARVAELLATVGNSAIKRLLVVNAASQAAVLEDVVSSYRKAFVPASAPANHQALHGAVLSKTDEAVQLGSALDVLIRNRMSVVYETNGQRVPEDMSLAVGKSLVLRAVTHVPARAFEVPAEEVALTFYDHGDEASPIFAGNAAHA
jgi:flagellar biosynthesis protein FlhF